MKSLEGRKAKGREQSGGEGIVMILRVGTKEESRTGRSQSDTERMRFVQVCEQRHSAAGLPMAEVLAAAG